MRASGSVSTRHIDSYDGLTAYQTPAQGGGDGLELSVRALGLSRGADAGFGFGPGCEFVDEALQEFLRVVVADIPFGVEQALGEVEIELRLAHQRHVEIA